MSFETGQVPVVEERCLHQSLEFTSSIWWDHLDDLLTQWWMDWDAFLKVVLDENQLQRSNFISNDQKRILNYSRYIKYWNYFLSIYQLQLVHSIAKANYHDSWSTLFSRPTHHWNEGLLYLVCNMSSQNEPTREILRMHRCALCVFGAKGMVVGTCRYYRQGAKGMVVGTRVTVWQFISSMVPG